MSAEPNRTPSRIALLLLGAVLSLAGIAGWILPWVFTPDAGGPEEPDLSALVAAQGTTAEIGDRFAALESVVAVAPQVDVDVLAVATQELQAAFLGAIESAGGDGAAEDTSSSDPGAGSDWRGIVDNLLVLGFEESRTLAATIGTWRTDLPAASERQNVLGPVSRVVAQLRSVVYDQRVISSSYAASHDVSSAGEQSTDLGPFSSVVSLIGLVVVVVAGFGLVALLTRLRPAVASGTASAGGGRDDSRSRMGETASGARSTILGDTDVVTGAEGRAVFERTLRGEIARTQRHDHALSLLAFGVDQIAGGEVDAGNSDYVLGTVGEIVQNNVRVSDVFARLADNTFAILLAETPLRGAERVAEKLRRNIEVFPFDDVHPCTVSVGISAFAKGDDGYKLLERAETAFQRSRDKGGNAITPG